MLVVKFVYGTTVRRAQFTRREQFVTPLGGDVAESRWLTDEDETYTLFSPFIRIQVSVVEE